MPDYKTNIEIGTTFKGEGAKQAEQAMRNVSNAAEGSQKNMGGLSQQAKDAGLSFNTIAKALGVLAIPAFVINSVNTYISTVKGTTELGNSWGVATDKLEKSYYSLGKAIATEVLPYLEKAAELTEKLAGVAIPQVSKVVAAGEQAFMLAELGMAKGLDWVAGLDPKNANKDPQSIQKTFLHDMADITGQGMSPEQNAKKESEAEAKKKELSKQRAMEVYQITRQEFEQKRAFDRSVLVMNRDFQRSEMLAIFDYNKSRTRAERDHNRQIMYATEDFQKSQFRAVRDFNRQIAITNESFNRGRMIANRDFQISLARNEYDYQKSRARAQYDHNWSIKTAMLQGDAWGVWQANRQFKIEKQRAEEDYQLGKSRSVEDFQRSQNDELVAFNIERANTLKGFEIQRADALMDFNIQRKRDLEQYKIMRDDQKIDFEITRERALFAKNQQLKDMIYMQTEETRLRYQQFIDQRIPELYWEGDTANKIATSNFTRVANTINDILAGMGKGNFVYTAPSSSAGSSYADYRNKMGYADGGYVNNTGMALVHSGEFVLTKDSVTAAEGLAKNNRLSQNELLNMMGGGGVNINNTFTRGMSADERFIIQQQFMQMAAGAFRK